MGPTWVAWPGGWRGHSADVFPTGLLSGFANWMLLRGWWLIQYFQTFVLILLTAACMHLYHTQFAHGRPSPTVVVNNYVDSQIRRATDTLRNSIQSLHDSRDMFISHSSGFVLRRVHQIHRQLHDQKSGRPAPQKNVKNDRGLSPRADAQPSHTPIHFNKPRPNESLDRDGTC